MERKELDIETRLDLAGFCGLVTHWGTDPDSQGKFSDDTLKCLKAVAAYIKQEVLHG